MVKTFLNYFKWRPLLLMESCQNLGKTLRKTNYSSEIYQVEPVSARNQPTNLRRKSIACLHKT